LKALEHLTSCTILNSQYPALSPQCPVDHAIEPHFISLCVPLVEVQSLNSHTTVDSHTT